MISWVEIIGGNAYWFMRFTPNEIGLITRNRAVLERMTKVTFPERLFLQGENR